MTYLVTGATGFLGRHVVEQLLRAHDGDIHVTVGAGSLHRLEQLLHHWQAADRVHPVVADLAAPSLGVTPTWLEEHSGRIEHVFHLVAPGDVTAPEEHIERLTLASTRETLALATKLGSVTFHHVSSIAVAGDYAGAYDETMFDVGQRLPSSYHRTRFEAERAVRAESRVAWRVYRPAIVVGHSRTGAIDKVDGPYYFFPLLKRLRDTLPQWAPLVGLDVGDTNIVPVDYVVRALDHLAHRPGLDGRAFHLVNPSPQPTTEVINVFAAAANAPRFAVPVDRRITWLIPAGRRPTRVLRAAMDSTPGRFALRQTLGRLGIPPEIIGQVSLPTTFASRQTERELADSGIPCPPLESYAAILWDYWEQHLDDSTARDAGLREALEGRTVVIAGELAEIGRATALRVAQAGGIPILVASGQVMLDATAAEIESAGGVAHVYSCDLSDMDAIDALAKQITDDHERINVVVNDAGRSIGRSLRLSYDRFHDFERTMQLNYFGAIRLVMALTPAMQTAGGGHVVNISSIDAQAEPPRVSAYVASTAALDAWSRVVSSQLVGDGITFTTLHMPRVRTPMIPTTKIFPTITPAQAADLVMRAIKEAPAESSTMLGTAGDVLHALAPKTVLRVLQMANRIFPDSAIARSGVRAVERPVRPARVIPVPDRSRRDGTDL